MLTSFSSFFHQGRTGRATAEDPKRCHADHLAQTGADPRHRHQVYPLPMSGLQNQRA